MLQRRVRLDHNPTHDRQALEGRDALQGRPPQAFVGLARAAHALLDGLAQQTLGLDAYGTYAEIFEFRSPRDANNLIISTKNAE